MNMRLLNIWLTMKLIWAGVGVAVVMVMLALLIMEWVRRH